MLKQKLRNHSGLFQNIDMATFTKVVEAIGCNSRLEIVCDATSAEAANELDYSDFNVFTLADNKRVVEISPLLNELGILETIIDKIDWREM